MPDPRVTEYLIRPDQEHAHLRLHPDQLAALPEHDYEKKLEEMHAALALLVQHARSVKRKLPVNEVASANTNASGNVTFIVHEVREGFRLEPRHVVIEAAGYTPAAPYTNASAYVYLAQGPQGSSPAIGQGGVLDFAPTTAGQQLFPAFASYAEDEVQVQGGHALICQVVTGPASRLITVRLQGWLVGEQV